MSAATVTTPAPSPLRRRALGVAAAVVACLAIWAIGALAGVDYTVESPGQPATVIGAGAIVTVALGAALLGWAALALLERFATRVARPVWISLAIVVTVLSFVPAAQRRGHRRRQARPRRDARGRGGRLDRAAAPPPPVGGPLVFPPPTSCRAGHGVGETLGSRGGEVASIAVMARGIWSQKVRSAR